MTLSGNDVMYMPTIYSDKDNSTFAAIGRATTSNKDFYIMFSASESRGKLEGNVYRYIVKRSIAQILILQHGIFQHIEKIAPASVSVWRDILCR